jgi:hypothetical protein
VSIVYCPATVGSLKEFRGRKGGGVGVSSGGGEIQLWEAMLCMRGKIGTVSLAVLLVELVTPESSRPCH